MKYVIISLIVCITIVVFVLLFFKNNNRNGNNRDENIYSIFNKADRAMYTHKAKLKGVYGRRIDD